VGDDCAAVTGGVFHSSDGRQIEIAVEDWAGTEETQTTATPAAESTMPTFTDREIVLIRDAVTSSQDTAECPRCAAPLTRSRLPRATQLDTWLVSCIMCRRNVVIRGTP